MVADGSALVGSKEMSPLYTNAAADLFGRFRKNFRNRVFHYEKVINKDNYNQIFDEIDEVLFYFDKELFDCVKKANNGWII